MYRRSKADTLLLCSVSIRRLQRRVRWHWFLSVLEEVLARVYANSLLFLMWCGWNTIAPRGRLYRLQNALRIRLHVTKPAAHTSLAPLKGWCYTPHSVNVDKLQLELQAITDMLIWQAVVYYSDFTIINGTHSVLACFSEMATATMFKITLFNT